jgi:dTDP-4-dehydrorhamnose 3,5-epimerase-like enzyme
MSDQENELWRGLAPEAQVALVTRDYRIKTFASQVGESGIEAGRLAAADRTLPEVGATWIPGVEIFARTVHPQRHRGIFGEFARRDEGRLSEIALWPQQWATARMFAQTAKGFHVHPPSIPKDTQPAEWLRWLFLEEPKNYAMRRYEQEQWDVMFFVQGVAEMILCDVRAGLPKRTMRFLIDGDNHRGANNVAVVIPPGVAHAIRAEGSEDVIMVYGTSTPFRPEFEGRIASDVETATLPKSWQKFLK